MMQDPLEKLWHHLPPDEVVTLLESNAERGLDTLELGLRQARFGPNALTPRRGKGPLLRFLSQFNNPLVYILLMAAVLTVFVKDLTDALTIFGVVLINAGIGYIQESRAENAIEALSKTLKTEATVMRAGQWQVVPATVLVPGDIVQLQSGNKVPADLRLIKVRDLQVAEAALTGESVAVEKCADLSLPIDAPLGDRRTMAYASTLVTYGQATGVVVATGDQTEVGRISQLLTTVVDLATPLTRQLSYLSQRLLYAILALALLVFAVGIWRQQPAADMLMAAIALAVGAIPEGLPAAVTITLAIGVARMARRRAIIRKLPAVETLGSTTVVCSDKTGTLTQNQMTVQYMCAGGVDYTVSGSGYAPQGQITPDPQHNQAALACLRAGMLCNDSVLAEQDGIWQAQGDPTEVALLVSAAKANLTPDTVPLARLDAIPFESQHQFMATLHAEDAASRIYLKGAVEVVLARCTCALGADGQPKPLDAATVMQAAESMAARGLRVLALARGQLPGEAQQLQHAQLSDGLEFLGLQAMLDPPRAEAKSAVRACHAAGIKVKMITGDHALTAAAIAEELGLQGERTASGLRTLSGRQLATMSDSQVIEAVEAVAVFARVAPEQKLRLVEALQACGHVVAMTGDGVNDAPALKQANIGVAMGVTGTEVSREAAAMVLTDDNFASIEAAIEEGRGVFDNLTKFLVWALPANIGIGMVITLSVLAGLPLPILATQVLWINMTTAGALGLVLAMEPKEAGLMQRPPRPAHQPILSGVLLFRIVLASLLVLAGAFGIYGWEMAHGTPIEQARTAAVNAIVVIQLLYLYNCRSLQQSIFTQGIAGNPWILAGTALMIGLQAAFTYLPFMHRIFATAAVGWSEWGGAAVVGLLAFLVIELDKSLRRR